MGMWQLAQVVALGSGWGVMDISLRFSPSNRTIENAFKQMIADFYTPNGGSRLHIMASWAPAV